MARQLFFIENKLLGEALRGPVLQMGEVVLPYSYLFVCGQSGEVFAKCPIIDASGKPRPWHVHTMLARGQSSSIGWTPGSIWTSWDHDFIGAFPDAVLQWELLRHLDNYERLK